MADFLDDHPGAEHALRALGPAGRRSRSPEDFQKQLAGHALRMIYLAQDYIATFCRKQNGTITTNNKAVIAALTKDVARWAVLLGKITTHRRLRDVAAHTLQTAGPACVYARVNLHNENDLYIGETEHLDQRINTHYYQTHRHSEDHPNPCKGCKDHLRYTRHRGARAHEWIMIPVLYTHTKIEALRIESKLIKSLKPNINQADKPFWLLKETYAKQCLYPKSRTEDKKPWEKLKARKQHTVVGPTAQTEPPEIPVWATYTIDEDTYFDFGALLHDLHTRETGATTIEIRPGKLDATKWARVNQLYGESQITTFSPEEYKGPLRLWKPRHGRVTAQIRVERACIATREELSVILEDAVDFQKQLADASDTDLAFYFRVRNTIDAGKKYKMRKLIWAECCERFGCTAKPLEIRLPYYAELNPRLVTQVLHRLIEGLPWPEYIQKWHKSKIKLITEKVKPIGDILSNVTKPWLHTHTCCCQQVAQNLGVRPPQTHGHIFFTSREYTGPHSEIFTVSGNNTPRQTPWDRARAWDAIYKTLPSWCDVTGAQWSKKLKQCLQRADTPAYDFPSTKAVYTFRKKTTGLVIGPLDKNTNELSFCCPILYQRAWKKMYDNDTGYKEIHTSNDSPLCGYCEEDTGNPPPTDNDVCKAWGKLYKKQGWQKIAPFKKTGSFNIPYVLFKAKNVTDPKIREAKIFKTRPIAPQTRHPMAALFGLSGRAWSFITAHLPGEHFVINHGGKVADFLDEVERDLKPLGDIKIELRDVEGCFSNMDKEIIRHAMRALTKEITNTTGHDAVMVPRRATSLPVKWKSKDKRYIKLPFELLHDVLNFALDNTLIKSHDGKLWKQMKGIPMGDPHSPGMCIGACAWMEKEWMATLTAETKRYFKAKRYMDDILFCYATNPQFDAQTLMADLSHSHCYLPPLKLEQAPPDTFLETTFRIENNHITYKIKNENHENAPPKTWRYAHFKDHTAFAQKRSVLQATLMKVHNLASDNENIYVSAKQKLAEFRRLQYPERMLWTACTTVGVRTRRRIWFTIRDELRTTQRRC